MDPITNILVVGAAIIVIISGIGRLAEYFTEKPKPEKPAPKPDMNDVLLAVIAAHLAKKNGK